MADITKDQVIEWLSGLSVLDIAALVKELEDKWGVSAAAPVAVVAGGAAAAPLKKRIHSTSFSKLLTLRRKSRSLRKSAQSLPSALRTQKPSLKALPSPSRKALQRPKPKKSPRSLKTPAPKSKSNNRLWICNIKSFAESSRYPVIGIPRLSAFSA